MRAWWAQISHTPFTGHRVRATMIRHPLIRYIHRCIVTTISSRGQSQEWVTTTDLFYLHLLIAGRPCNLFCGSTTGRRSNRPVCPNTVMWPWPDRLSCRTPIRPVRPDGLARV
ncbi:hypothetical protein R6Q57_015871 [Mikania cordata]